MQIFLLLDIYAKNEKEDLSAAELKLLRTLIKDGHAVKITSLARKFAELLGISGKTLHNWEQGRRKPTGAARVLLRVVSRRPELILEEALA